MVDFFVIYKCVIKESMEQAAYKVFTVSLNCVADLHELVPDHHQAEVVDGRGLIVSNLG